MSTNSVKDCGVVLLRNALNHARIPEKRLIVVAKVLQDKSTICRTKFIISTLSNQKDCVDVSWPNDETRDKVGCSLSTMKQVVNCEQTAGKDEIII